MPGQLFILNTPTLAISKNDRAPIMIPQHAAVTVGQRLDGQPTFVEVQWEGDWLLMFVVDLQQRGTPVQSAAELSS